LLTVADVDTFKVWVLNTFAVFEPKQTGVGFTVEPLDFAAPLTFPVAFATINRRG
jgi:hypothetical protein